jgi:hypothetical protein
VSRKDSDEPLYRRPESEDDLVETGQAPESALPSSVPVPEPGAGDEEPRGVVVSLLASEVDGDHVSFVSLPGRLLIVEEQEGESDLGVFADAIEKRLSSPYRAQALRVDRDRFVAVAGEIETVVLPGLDGDELIVFALPGGQRAAVLDGKALLPIPVGLEPILAESEPCLLTLSNVDEETWEVSIDLL